jgi:hypothetical protein
VFKAFKVHQTEHKVIKACKAVKVFKVKLAQEIKGQLAV